MGPGTAGLFRGNLPLIGWSLGPIDRHASSYGKEATLKKADPYQRPQVTVSSRMPSSRFILFSNMRLVIAVLR